MVSLAILWLSHLNITALSPHFYWTHCISAAICSAGWIGELQIPFTTGVLLGIGEAPGDTHHTLEAIAASHARHGHIQECIVQPFREGNGGSGSFPLDKLPEVVELAAAVLPPDVAIQVTNG